VTSFRVFLEAEIEIERDLIRNLVVNDETPVTDLTVDLRVDIWFERSDGFTEIEIGRSRRGQGVRDGNPVGLGLPLSDGCSTHWTSDMRDNRNEVRRLYGS